MSGRGTEIHGFPWKIMIFDENAGILDLWEHSKGSREVPRGFMVPI